MRGSGWKGGKEPSPSSTTSGTHRRSLTDGRETIALTAVHVDRDGSVVGVFHGAVGIVPATGGRVGTALDDFGYPSIVPLGRDRVGVTAAEAVELMSPFATGRPGRSTRPAACFRPSRSPTMAS